MSISGIELKGILAQTVNISDDALIVDLSDGRTITAPLAWFPRLTTVRRPSGTTGDWSLGVRGFTGRTRMRTSASRVFSPDADLARARNHSNAGSTPGHQHGNTPFSSLATNWSISGGKVFLIIAEIVSQLRTRGVIRDDLKVSASLSSPPAGLTCHTQFTN